MRDHLPTCYLSPMNQCAQCHKTFSSEQMLQAHTFSEHSSSKPKSSPAVGRQKFSAVASTTATGEAKCPKCGGTAFTAKRSVKGKVIGFTTLGVGGLLAPKSQVKCVTCGEMFKRG
jgi:DNA-directed RNA polymerase subunit RPC12/RpoP